MIKLLRDSIFKPKNLISYRAKKWWFVLLYVLIVGLLGSLSYITKPITDNGLTDADMITQSYDIRNKNAKIENGVFSGDTVTIDICGYIVTFIDGSKELKSVIDSDVIVKGSTVYLYASSLNTSYYPKVTSLTELSDTFKETIVIDGGFDKTSLLFKGLNETFLKYKPLIITIYLFSGLFSSVALMLGFTLLNYLWLVGFYRAKQFMKKGQLFKMLLFASTAIVLADSIVNMLNLPTIVYYLAMFVAFIPEMMLEREIIKRIRMKLYGDQIINNEDVINKINEMLNKNKKKDDDDTDNDSKNDDEE